MSDHPRALARLARALSFLLALALAGTATAADRPAHATQNVITVIIDGARWEEVFGGVDQRFLAPEGLAYFRQPEKAAEFRAQFWRDDPAERRRIVMPFFWSVVARDGQLYGDRAKGSEVRLRNNFHISYPGHSEFLTGFADDARIVSNAFVPNPNRSFLEILAAQPAFGGKVAAISGWDAYPSILNVARSGLPVHSPSTPTTVSDGAGHMDLLRSLLTDTGPSLHTDALTFHFALEYLKLKRPRVLHVTFQNVDRTGHWGHYDDHILALQSADSFIRRLWEWTQSDPQYRGRTTLIVAADHGRGGASLEMFKTHGVPGYRPVLPGEVNPTEGDQYSWIAIMGPDTPAKGEMTDTPPVELAQVAATVTTLLGYDLKGDDPSLTPSPPIATAISAAR